MLYLIQPAIGRALTATARSLVTSTARRSLHTRNITSSGTNYGFKALLWGSAIAASALAISHAPIHLDAEPEVADETVDPATSIAFPNTLVIPSKSPLPKFSLVGVGVRTVSFLGIKVYSVGFYADLDNPRLNIPKTATPEEKLQHIVQNSGCVIRIIPTRSTSFSHLRDGFMRALQARMVLCRQRGTLTKEEELSVQSPLHKFKTMFPNTPMAKHAPLDILLAPPEPRQPRNLIVRDLGSVQHDWLAQEFVLAYFEGNGISPPLKKAVVDRLADFGQ